MTFHLEPFRVVFSLGSPVVVPDHPIHLDALLAWVGVEWARDLRGQEDLPLDRAAIEGGEWVWKASWIEFRGISQRWQIEYVRSFDPWQRALVHSIGVLKDFRTIRMDSGVDKAYKISMPVMAASEAVGYGVGDIDCVHSMIRNVHYLGKLRRLGYGLVRCVDVVRDPRAEEFWRYRNGCWVDTENRSRIFAAMRPPYWERRRFVETWRPIQVPDEFLSDGGGV